MGELPMPALAEESEASHSSALEAQRRRGTLPEAAEFASQLRKLPQLRRISPRQLGSAVRQSNAAIGHYLRGTRVPSWGTTMALLDALGASPEQYQRIRQAWERAAREQERAARQVLNGGVVVQDPFGDPVSVSNVVERDSRVSVAGEAARKTSPLRGFGAPPSPLLVNSVTEFVEALRAVRIWAGSPSLRDLEACSGGKMRRATVGDMFGKGKLPKYNLMMTFLSTCGVDDLATWSVIWRRLRAIEDVRESA